MIRNSTKRFIGIGLALSLAFAPLLAYAESSNSASEDAIYSAITDEEVASALEGVDLGAEQYSRSATTSTTMQTFSGIDRYHTSALQAKTWKTSSYVVICNGDLFPDALSASSLAGALSCPILLAPTASLSAYTKDALSYLKSIGVNKAIIIGGTSVISNNVVNQVNAMGINVQKRIAGADRFATQIELFKYGKNAGYWSNDLLVITAGGNKGFGDALSASPLTYNLKAPIFLANDSGVLTAEQKAVLNSGVTYNRAILVGGPACLKNETLVYARTISRSAEQVYGSDRYATSAELATRAISLGYLNTNNVAFTSGEMPWDALGGGALQGRDRSVLLLVSVNNAGNAIAAVAPAGASTVRFFGGVNAISQNTRVEILNAIGASRVNYKTYNISLDRLAQLEASANGNYSKDQILAYIDPTRFSYGDSKFYQFAILSDGYSGITAKQMDDFIARQCAYQEKKYGTTSKLRGMGSSFVTAAQTYGINEVYLLCHAALESAWGCSTLAQGKVSGYENYFNFYGIGAHDLDPQNSGAALAKKEGWNTPQKAIEGAAAWISKNYVKPTVSSASVSGSQNTLYKMRWDVSRAVSQGAVWHQYATSITWATGIADVMAGFYSSVGKNIETSGLQFEVPLYN